MILTFLDDLKDHRRAQGRRYEINYVILFSIMAILSNAKSYRQISSFIKTHFELFRQDFKIKWKKSPAYTTVRNIIKGVDPLEIEACFRAYSQSLVDDASQTTICIAADGKVLRGSFDHFEDRNAIQILSLFDTEREIILAHQKIDEKTNEIPVFQKLLEELGIDHVVYTLDALHCQKKLLKLRKEMIRG